MNLGFQSCPKELFSQDVCSFGVIAGDEIIGRGAYEPSHGTASTLNIKKGLFSWKELLSGLSSVWRVGDPGIALDTLRARLDAEKAGLFAIAGVPANDIRAIDHDNSRLLCVIDECDTDFAGGKHPAHGHIAICPSQIPPDEEGQQIVGLQAVTSLWQVFRDKKIWVKFGPDKP